MIRLPCFERRKILRLAEDIGIDLGTATFLIYTKSRGLVLKAPSVIAMTRDTRQVRAVGEEAYRMLGRTPAVERAMVAELRQVLGSAAPGIEHVQRLPFTSNVIKEALRLYPPVSSATVDATSRWLDDHPSAPKGLVRLMRENLADAKRALEVQRVSSASKGSLNLRG